MIISSYRKQINNKLDIKNSCIPSRKRYIFAKTGRNPLLKALPPFFRNYMLVFIFQWKDKEKCILPSHKCFILGTQFPLWVTQYRISRPSTSTHPTPPPDDGWSVSPWELSLFKLSIHNSTNWFSYGTTSTAPIFPIALLLVISTFKSFQLVSVNPLKLCDFCDHIYTL